MKRFLLLLSCYLVAWCSVQASMLQGFSATSMVLASAPAVAPAPSYPAVIKSATYIPETKEIKVEFIVNSGSKVSFDIETNSGPKTSLNEMNVISGHSYTTNIKLQSEWGIGLFVTVKIKVDDAICGGTGVPTKEIPQPKTSVSVGEISHDAVNGIVTVNYTISNSTSGTTQIIVSNNDKGLEIYKKNVSSSLRSYQLPSSIFVKNTNYSIKIINGEGVDVQNFKITDTPSGQIKEVYFCGSEYNTSPDYAVFKYNLKDTYNPYIYIMEGERVEYGPIVETIKIRNTNCVYAEAILSDCYSVLREKTTYTACLYDVQQNGNERNLGIVKEFRIPTKEPIYETYPDWTFDHYTNTLKIKAPGIWPSYIQNVTVRVYYSDATGNYCGLHDQKIGNFRNQYASIAIPTATARGRYYILEVTGGSYKCSLKVCISNHLNK